MTLVNNEMPSHIRDIKTEYYQAFFGDKWSYYLPVMIDFERGKKFRFNVWAFFCGIFWQLYRKLYMAMLLFIIVITLELILKNWTISDWDLDRDTIYFIKLIETLVFGIIYGYTGNYFLMQKAQSKIKQVLSSEDDENMILEKLKKAGSGNLLGLILLLVFIVGIFALASVQSKV